MKKVLLIVAIALFGASLVYSQNTLIWAILLVAGWIFFGISTLIED